MEPPVNLKPFPLNIEPQILNLGWGKVTISFTGYASNPQPADGASRGTAARCSSGITCEADGHIVQMGPVAVPLLDAVQASDTAGHMAQDRDISPQ